jgi:Zn-finger nucleic acid-binding protein
MEKVRVRIYEVDRCTGCKGLWFDSLELERLRKVKGAASIDTGDPAVGKLQDAKQHVLCPLCKTQMIRMVDPKRPNVSFESCPVCYGVYLDAGEFKESEHDSLLDFLRRL